LKGYPIRKPSKNKKLILVIIMEDDYGGEDAPPFGLRGSALEPPRDTFICPYNLKHEIR